MPDDLDDVTIPGDLDDLDNDLDDELEIDDADTDDLGDDDLDDDDLDSLGDDELDDDDDDDDVGAGPATDTVERAGTEETEEEDEEDEDEEDVEASLDVILKERLVVIDDEPDDDETTDVEDRGEGGERVLPKQPDEFVCRSCFLVKHPSQLADKKLMLCRDCV
jgi:hypothetical protein